MVSRSNNKAKKKKKKICMGGLTTPAALPLLLLRIRSICHSTCYSVCLIFPKVQANICVS